MNRLCLLSIAGLLLSTAQDVPATPVPIPSLKRVVDASDVVCVCRIDGMATRTPRGGETGMVAIAATRIKALKGAAPLHVDLIVRLMPEGPTANVDGMATNTVAVLFLRAGVTSGQFVPADRWLPAIQLHRFYDEYDSERQDVVDRVLAQLAIGARSADPAEVRDSLRSLQTLNATTNHLDAATLWTLAGSERLDIRVPALTALVRSGDAKAIGAAVTLAVGYRGGAAEAEHDALIALLWLIAGRHPEMIPGDVARDLSVREDGDLSRIGLDVLRRKESNHDKNAP
jgi:hypothetical protein